VKFVSRREWGARPPRSRSSLSSPRGVTIHWEGPRMGPFPHSSCASKVRGIQNFHMDSRRWSDVAYTAIVCPHGYVYECRGVGVRTAANGTSAGNASWYAVCALAGRGDPATPELLRGLSDAIEWLRRSGAGNAVNGHRDHKATECPGDRLYQWARTYVPPLPPASPIPDIEEDEIVLKRGDKGDAVAVFQRALQGWSSKALPRYGADKDFGQETEDWVEAYQQAADISVTGRIDGVTAALLVRYVKG
jgi:hypothetical protein